MYYQVSGTVNPNISYANRKRFRVYASKGIINRVLIGFPPGCFGLLRIQVYDKGWQILPFSHGESMGWDSYVYDVSLNYNLDSEPYELEVRAWNLDDTYEHSFFVGIEIKEENIVASTDYTELVNQLLGAKT